MRRFVTSVLLLNLLALPVQAAAETAAADSLTKQVSQPAVTETSNGDSNIGSVESEPAPAETTNGESYTGSGTAETTEQPAVDQGAAMEKQQAALVSEGRWVVQNGYTYYYVGDQPAKGWQNIEDKWYFFDLETGVMHTGWIEDENNWYYLNEAGIMQTGWILYENEWYFLKDSGAMVTGWAFVEGKWYFLRDSGAMQTGWLYKQTNWYYLKESGAMMTGWLMLDDSWYYFYNNGIMAENTTVQGSTLGSNGAWIANLVNPKQAYSYNDMVADINKLKKNFPGFIETQIIGKSVDGRNLYAIKLGKGDREIFFNGSHHAREHMTTNLLMEMLDQYASSYSANSNFNSYNVRELLNKVSIWFVPMVNPDGVMLVQEGHLTAKNPQYVLQLNGGKTDFSSWKANIRGVDLNRQYPADWANIQNNTGKPSPENFKGYQPLSEPEVQAVSNFVKAHHFKIATAYHSSGRILYWNFHQATAEYNRDYQIALKYSKLTGYSLVYPGPNPSGGGFTDWFIQDMKLPGFTPEISTATYSKPVPLANFDTIWKENQSAGLMLAMEALKL